MSKVVRRLIWCLCAYLLLCTIAALFLVGVTLHLQPRPLPASAETEVRHVVSKFGARLEDIEINAYDRAPLHAWYIAPEHGNDNAVILLHGLGDNRLGMTGYAQLLLKNGYTVLMPDARAHGVSGGDVATYGLLERDDIRMWFEWLQRTAHPQCIFGLGESMGAAQLLQSVASEPHFCAVVAESSFATFREIAYDRMGQYFHAGPWVGRVVLRPVVEIALTIVRFRYHLNLAKASPADVVATTRVPILLIHGQVDSNIPIRHSKLIKARNPQVNLWEVPSADHCGATSVAPAEFERRVVGWFQTHGTASMTNRTQTTAASHCPPT